MKGELTELQMGKINRKRKNWDLDFMAKAANVLID